MPRRVRILVARVKEVCASNAAERAQRRSEIVVIARRKNAAASFVKARDAFAVGLRQTVTSIDRKQPELVEIRFVELAQQRIVAGRIRLAIACGDLIERRALFVSERTQVFAQQRKS